MCEITESIGEAGNLKAETLRILINNEICVDEYEANDNGYEFNQKNNKKEYEPVFESLKVFANNVDAQTKEWIIP